MRRRILAAVSCAAIFLAAAASAYAADGDLNTNFNGTGTLTGNFGSTGAQLFRGVVQPDGKLVVVGSREGEGVVARFNPDGTPDAGFGISGTGYTIVDSGTTTGGERLRAVTCRGTRRGGRGREPLRHHRVRLARLNSDGSPTTLSTVRESAATASSGSARGLGPTLPEMRSP